MTFAKWFRKYQGTDTDNRAAVKLSAKCGVSVNTIKSALRGARVGARTALKLSQASGGEFTPWSLCKPQGGRK
jgi:hypothetical protein